MEEEKMKNFSCKTDYDTCFNYILHFNGKIAKNKKGEKLTANEQNNLVRKNLIATAEKFGYSPEVMRGIRDIINSTDYSFQPSELIYQKNSASALQRKLQYTKSSINRYLANEKVNSQQNQKTAKAQSAKPFNFVSNSRVLARVCMSTEGDANLAVHDEAVKQALAQGFSQDDLYKTVSVISIGKPPMTRQIPINPPQKMIDAITDLVQKQVQILSNRISSQEELLALARASSGEKHGVNKLRIMCYLKECPIQEFRNLINKDEVKNLFGERELARLKKSREQDAAQMDVVESGKQTEEALEGKTDEPLDNSPLNDDEQEKVILYGLETDGLVASEIRKLIAETESLLLESELVPMFKPHN